jgi:hypothetical protein
MLLELRAEHVSKQIALNIPVYYEASIRESGLKTVSLGVTHEICLDSKDRREVIDKSTTTTEDVETGDWCDIGMDVNERESQRDFDLGMILRSHGHRC